MSIVALKLGTLSVANTIVLGRKIVAAMAANAEIFEEPPFALAALTADLNDLEKRQQQATGGARSRDNILLRNEKLAEVRNLLTRLGSYVQTVSNGEATVINLAGMEVRARGPRKSESILPPVGLTVVSTTYPGQLKIRWRLVRNALTYGVEYCPGTVTPDKWKVVAYATATSVLVSELPSGEIASFRVFAIGAAGTSAHSEVVSRKLL